MLTTASSQVHIRRIELLTLRKFWRDLKYRLVNTLVRAGDIPSIALRDRRRIPAEVIDRGTRGGGNHPMTEACV